MIQMCVLSDLVAFMRLTGPVHSRDDGCVPETTSSKRYHVAKSRSPGVAKRIQLKPASKEPFALKAIRKSAAAKLPSEVESYFQQCKQDHTMFWTIHTTGLDIQSHHSKSLINMLSAIYTHTDNLQKNQTWSVIVWRFLVLFFYDLKMLLSSTYLTSKDEKDLIQLLQTSRAIEDTNAIESNIVRWISSGARYHQLCLSLDDGALFLLPQTVTCKTYVCVQPQYVDTDHAGGRTNYLCLVPCMTKPLIISKR